MALVYAAIIPHGDELLPIHPPLDALEDLQRALQAIGRELRAAQPDLVVICSPHHLRIPGQLAIADSAYLSGTLSGPLGTVVRTVRTDRSANRAIATAATESGLPPALCGYATAEESELSCLPLDWGCIVPLHFISDGEPPFPVAVLGPPRDIGLRPLRAFGAHLRTQLADRRFALVASADLGHAHEETGPYGYDPAANVYDAAVQDAVSQGDLSLLAAIPDDVLARAKADAPWQLAILEGALGRKHDARHAAYARPTYFGMLGTGFAPSEQE
jgi:aromatic ring-opening dioxygenase LigB subunit